MAGKRKAGKAAGGSEVTLSNVLCSTFGDLSCSWGGSLVGVLLCWTVEDDWRAYIMGLVLPTQGLSRI